MDGDDSYDGASTDAAMPQPASSPQPPLDGDTPESFANLALFVASLSHPVPWNRAYTPFAHRNVDGGIIGVDDAYRSGGFGAVPASGGAIAGLPEKAVGESEAREEECTVCLEGYEAGDTLRTMPCSHGFHERCIMGWLRVSRLCPLCRFALPAEEETESDTGDEEEGDDDGEEEPRTSSASSSFSLTER